MRKAFCLVGSGPPIALDHIPADMPGESIRQGTVDGCYWYMHHGPWDSIQSPVRDEENVPVCL
tara:strand:+ start:127 stop:315 length:189 start_codon:yes stop_codon:yes gene_type:complete